jgi:hypothetical protein
VDLSGIIFVVLAVAWAVFLIPKALKHHDEAARTRSIDRFSNAMRVLARREPVSRRDARLVVTGPSRATLPPVAAEVAAEVVAEKVEAAAVPVSRARLQARRKAARVAARRRRRVLLFLLVCTLGTGVAGYLGYLPLWSVAVPAALTLLWLVLCRTQVRHETLRDFEVIASDRAEAERSDESESPAPHRTVRVEAKVDAEFGDTEDTVGIPVALLDAVVVPTEDGGTLWDPLPVTLPTYVGKATAKRTVRTIDLGEPGTWTSGRTAEDAALVAEAEAAQQVAADEADEAGQQRAVGS